ncbi:MAG: DUF1579 family protein [Pyrinomonadaceae bacterium]|nr:DUF1579 family protein [Pyrinomonadaceae bacterium]
MSIHPRLAAIAGNWDGTNRLHLPWMPEPLHESPSTAHIRERVGGQCLEIEYTWEYKGKQKEGLLVLCGSPKVETVSALWTDSWHSANALMMCSGTVDENGHVTVRGSYSVPDHPDWGWRTDIIPGEDSFEYVMYNVSPEGVEELAVETVFSRSGG